MKNRVLLVDEDAAVREALGQALAFDHFDVVPAASRQQALDLLEEQDVDLLLLDLNPCSEDAWQTIKRVKALRPRLPILALTARPEQHEAICHSPALRVLPKPLDLPFLIQTLKELGPTRSPNRSPDVLAGRLTSNPGPTNHAVPPVS